MPAAVSATAAATPAAAPQGDVGVEVLGTGSGADATAAAPAATLPSDIVGNFVRDDDLIVELPLAGLPQGVTAGDNVSFQNGAQGVVLEVTDEVYRVDVNHELAGNTLTFEIELISIQ